MRPVGKEGRSFMLKRFAAAVCALVCLVSFAGCSGPKYEALSSKYDKDKVVAAAQQTVTLMNAAEYQKITDMTRDDVKAQLTADVLKSAADKVMPKAGAFVSFGDTTAAGYSDPKTSEEYAVVVVPAKYQNQTMTYTVSFNTDLQIVGFYVK